MTQMISEAHVRAFRRGSRRNSPPVDISHFRHQIEQAMEAFQTDVSYAVHMARAAVTIARKREVWQARRDAKQNQP